MNTATSKLRVLSLDLFCVTCVTCVFYNLPFQKVHIDFTIKENSHCESSCDWVKTGACGSAFGGVFKCQFKIHCTNNICTCHLYADCQKSRHQVQEILQKAAPKIIKKVGNDETYQIIDGNLILSANTSTTTQCLKIIPKVSLFPFLA